jgi:hypothetical protein
VGTGRGKWSARGSNPRPRTPREHLLPLQHFSICDTLTIVCFIYLAMELRDHVATLGWSSCFAGTTWRTVTSFPPSFFFLIYNQNLKLVFHGHSNSKFIDFFNFLQNHYLSCNIVRLHINSYLIYLFYTTSFLVLKENK